MAHVTVRTAHQLADLDAGIRDALIVVRRARVALVHSTNADTVRIHDEAQAKLDELLDARLAVQPRRPSWRS